MRALFLLLLLAACAATEEKAAVVVNVPPPPVEEKSCVAVHDFSQRVSVYWVAISGTRTPMKYSLPWGVLEKGGWDWLRKATGPGRIGECVRANPPPPLRHIFPAVSP